MKYVKNNLVAENTTAGSSTAEPSSITRGKKKDNRKYRPLECLDNNPPLHPVFPAHANDNSCLQAQHSSQDSSSLNSG